MASEWATAVGTALPSLVWAAFATTAIVIFRTRIGEVFDLVAGRIRKGGSIKLGAVELAQVHVSRETTIGSAPGIRPGKAPTEWIAARRAEYERLRGIIIVHRLSHSTKPNQLYELLIYAVPHRGSIEATHLGCVASITYFFGGAWDDKTFTSTLREQGFPVSTSAYGPFLCGIEIEFTDGTRERCYRYIDFEMGDVAARSPAKRVVRKIVKRKPTNREDSP